MTRSLRAVGCNLPIWVIPYDSQPFTLPENAIWWTVPEIKAWVQAENLNQRKQKFQCLTTANYQFADTDVFFLRNPERVLAPHSGLIACCNEWTIALHGGRVASKDSIPILKRATTLWQRNVFCSGQFACESALYAPHDLIEIAAKPEHASTCMHPPFGDQEGINLLVSLSGVSVTNLTLPPFLMESSWAGDYPDDPAPYWQNEERKPYLIHYYGHAHRMHEDRRINDVFKELLTREEQQQWIEESQRWHEDRMRFDEERANAVNPSPSKVRKLFRRINRASRMLIRGY